MRSAVCGIVVGLTLLARQASAHPEAEAGGDHDALWDGQVEIGASGEVDRTRPLSPVGPLQRSGQVAPAVTGTYFLSPLVDEADGHLALLRFYQHPGSLELTLRQENDFSDVAGEWNTSRRALAMTAAAEGYPWHETGLRGLFGSHYAGLSGDVRATVDLSYELGLVHYFRPNLRGELSYVGAVSQGSRAVGNAKNAAIEDNESVSNSGRAAAEAIILDDRFGLRAQVDVGQVSQDRTATGLGGAGLPGDVTRGLLFSGEATATAYIARNLAPALSGGLHGRTTTTHADNGAVGTSTSTTLVPFIHPHALFFFRDDLFLQADYTLSFPHVDGDQSPSSNAVEHDFSLALGLRI